MTVQRMALVAKSVGSANRAVQQSRTASEVPIDWARTWHIIAMNTAGWTILAGLIVIAFGLELFG